MFVCVVLMCDMCYWALVGERLTASTTLPDLSNFGPNTPKHICGWIAATQKVSAVRWLRRRVLLLSALGVKSWCFYETGVKSRCFHTTSWTWIVCVLSVVSDDGGDDDGDDGADGAPDADGTDVYE